MRSSLFSIEPIETGYETTADAINGEMGTSNVL